ncbi:MAG: hypothetical protein PHP57_13495 [Sideroxydans sp.]|nr:hypothetical protein [Sideroxydans sp.]
MDDVCEVAIAINGKGKLTGFDIGGTDTKDKNPHTDGVTDRVLLYFGEIQVAIYGLYERGITRIVLDDQCSNGGVMIDLKEGAKHAEG